MPGRIFTPEQATATLPLVRRIVQDAMRLYRRLRRRVTIFRRLRALGVPPDRVERIRTRLERLGRRLEEIQAELVPIGCQLKDYQRGVVDFPGLLDGRAVELCWRLGEPAVAHWHDVGAGYTSRKPCVPEPAARR